MRRVVFALVTLGLLLGLAAPAQAATSQSYAPVEIVHQERLTVGPYELTVGFSEWPVRARQSLDFTFVPASGIEQLSGTLVAVSPTGEEDELRRPAGVHGLPRHPRQPDVWGLDVFALDEPGDWTFTFGLDGPQGPATADVIVPVLDQPGPPLGLSWLVSTGPLIVILGMLAAAVRRGGRAIAAA
ncbi:hypothetical protein FHX44_115554 [Pseudonocardia hierapolitana]|uniref:CopC domain-containing protein n=1 Tax=Pseudonocardia hierapolitana TaxID=1128676 RepID=A0A561SXM3_9PSEU|nr:hypothetical protein [Pseudonocardia hierapolitana]TWF79620.1 hypothetical protein FHX44_115554 [Pseudonocardia hierapolitana]